MAPDKIYVPQYITFSRTVQELDKPIVAGSTEYIRKDALLEWLNEYKDNPVITELQQGNIQELIDKIKLL